MCGRRLWSVEGSFPWLESYPDGVSEHCAIVVGIGSLLPQSDAVGITKKLSGGHGNTTFPCVEWVCGREFSMDGKLSRWNQ